MKFRLILASELDQGLVSQWEGLRACSTMYDSPYYHPAFTRIVARARPDARILLCEDAGRQLGIWPFHALDSRHSVSIGDFLADYQGPIGDPSIDWSRAEVLRAMGSRYFSYNHVPAGMSEFNKNAWTHSQSPFLDLQGGFDAYAQRLSEQREASLLKKVATNERKLGKKMGELRFELQSTADADYLALLAGKSEQFQRTVGAEHDIFKLAWVRQVVDDIRASREEEFAGVLSSLYAGDTLIAAHFGMRSKNVLHYWFPWYSTDYAEFSPGLILLAQCAKNVGQFGVTSIDLGRGDQAYKLRFATGAHALCEGAISSPAWLRDMQAGLYHGKRLLKQSALGQYLRGLRHAGKPK